DMKRQTVGLAKHSREHCHLFLQRHCHDCGHEPEKFFGKITAPANAEDTLDDVVDRVIDGAVVDAVALNSYGPRQPGRFPQLKVIHQSERFPAAVVAFVPGALTEETLNRFRDGLINANKNTLGRQFMTLWKLTGFEPVPTDYEQVLAT